MRQEPASAFQFSLRSVVIGAIVLSASLGFWAQYREVMDTRRQVEALLEYRKQAEREIANLRRQVDRLQFWPITAYDGDRRAHSDIVEALRPYGVRLFVDRSGRIRKAEVPDTTNTSVVCEHLKTIPDLTLVHFTTGPLLPNPDWKSPRFAAEYAEAINRPFSRTKVLDSQYREGVLHQFRPELPNVAVTEWDGAF